MKKLDLNGKTFGRLTAISVTKKGIRNKRAWVCQCECGSEVILQTSMLMSGHTRSCGCLHREEVGNMSRSHGLSQTPEYNVWMNMKARCSNPNNDHYKYYGGRGIRVCERWRTSFEDFLHDMGSKPAAKHSIDRMNNDGNYTKENCRWATANEQARNKGDNVLTYQKVSIANYLLMSRTVAAVARIFRVSHSTMNNVSLGRAWADVPSHCAEKI